jgi:hypothetical protein
MCHRWALFRRDPLRLYGIMHRKQSKEKAALRHTHTARWQDRSEKTPVDRIDRTRVTRLRSRDASEEIAAHTAHRGLRSQCQREDTAHAAGRAPARPRPPASRPPPRSSDVASLARDARVSTALSPLRAGVRRLPCSLRDRGVGGAPHIIYRVSCYRTSLVTRHTLHVSPV